jgi:glucose dehydrogenase
VSARQERPRRLRVAIGVIVLVASSSTAASASAEPTSSETATGRAPAPATGWPLPGQNYDNARAAVGSRIIAANVERLEIAFATDVPGVASLSTAPLVVGRTVLLQGGSGAVVAVDADTGATRWTSPATGINIGPYGVALADGRVFADAGSDGVLALDETTGTELWRTRLTTTPTLGIDIQPTVFDGIVFAATVPVSTRGIFTPGDRGTM